MTDSSGGVQAEAIRRSTELLSTKLFVPRSRQRLVARGRLDAVLDRPAPLILIAAPAGFGKSTAVVDWLHRHDVRASWLSLEAFDNEPRRFYRYLLAAWRKLVPSVGGALEAALDAPGPLLADTELTAFVNEIGALSSEVLTDDLVLVLDDYHLIDTPAIHHFIEVLVGALPPGVRLIMTTRADPPFALPRWRARGLLTELRAADLRFTADEAAKFLSDAMDVELTPGDARALHGRTEGWIAGLQLAGLSLRGHLGVRDGVEQSAREFIRDFTGSHRFVLDYLTDEVLGRQDEASLDFLLRISCLDEICGPLADAVTAGEDGRKQLEALEVENLFLLPLDDRREWFRFHHLFAECLRRYGEERLSEAERRDVHRRAFDWLLAADRPDAALGHALAAEDPERARRLLRSHADLKIHQGDVESVSRWLDRVPPGWIAGDPLLTVTRALVRFMLLDWSGLMEMQTELDREEPEGSSQDEAAKVLAGRRAMLRLLAVRALGEQEQVIEAGREALRLMPESEVLLRGTAAVLLGGALLRREDWPEAVRVLRLGLELNRASGNRMGLASCYYNWTRLLVHQGRPRDALRLARDGLEEINRFSGGDLVAVGSLVAVAEAEALLELGDLEEASRRAQLALDVNAGAVLPVDLGILIAQVRIARTARRFDEALESLDRLDELLRHVGLERWQRQRAYYAAKVWSVQALVGDRSARTRWGAWVEEDGCLEPDVPPAEMLLSEAPFEGAVALACRWLLESDEEPGNDESGKRETMEKALGLIRQLRTAVEDGGWVRSLLVTWLLEARALELLGDDPTPGLRRALELGQESGFLHVFADEREWLAPRLTSPEVAPLLARLDATYRDGLLTALNLPHVAGTRSPSGPLPRQDLPEPLSEREIEVLSSVAEGRTNAEVGEHLFIAPSTVKKHLENIYGKLAVGGRLEAVTKARSLGLLPTIDPP